MNTFISAILVAAATALATTWITGMTIAPRLEARKARHLKIFRDRDQFSDSVLTILSSCGQLRAFNIPPGITEPLRSSLEDERKRWLRQIDDSTRWLVDNIQNWAGSYRNAGGLRDLAIRYAADARGVVISGREESAKISILQEITEPVQGIFFEGWPWHRAIRLQGNTRRLREALDKLDADKSEE